jgi:hypothetical protein
MRKRILLTLILLAVAVAGAWKIAPAVQTVTSSEGILRLHVIANSDSEPDQSAKLAVRDAILPLFSRAESYEDARAFLLAHGKEIRSAAEAVGYLALTGGDRLRVICLQEAGNRMSPPLAGRQAYARLEQFLDTVTPGGTGRLTETVQRAEGLRRGLCFLISDCYAEEGLDGALDYLRYCRQETGVIQVLSAFELRPELEGALRALARPGDIILTVGAGDVYKVGEHLVAQD